MRNFDMSICKVQVVIETIAFSLSLPLSLPLDILTQFLLPVRSGLNPSQLSLNIQKGRHDGLCDPCQAMKGGSIEGGSAPIGGQGDPQRALRPISLTVNMVLTCLNDAGCAYSGLGRRWRADRCRPNFQFRSPFDRKPLGRGLWARLKHRRIAATGLSILSKGQIERNVKWVRLGLM
jgi:hypothetical protein